jgi:glycosyltransferase involved in cell wall biosynthesis
MKLNVTLISEGSYPTGKGGVSEWCHSLINEMKDINFNIISMSSEKRIRYTLPSNLNDLKVEYLHSPTFKKGIDENIAKAIIQELNPVLTGESLDCKELVMLLKKHEFTAEELLGSETNWSIATSYYNKHYKGKPFAPFYIFWSSLFYLLYKTLEMVKKVPYGRIYHVLNAGYAGLLGCLSKLNTGGNLIITEHGLYLKERKFELENSEVPIWLRGIYERFFQSLVRTSYKFSDLVTSVCQDHTLYQKNIYNNLEKIKVVYNGIDPEKFNNSGSRLNEDPDIFTIGTITRITPIKDTLTLIRSARHVLDKHNAIFYIVGEVEDDEYYVECKELIDKMNLTDSIKFTGFQDSLEWYPKFDIFVLPSLSEGFPLSILEALSFGIPCVATKVGGVPEILNDEFLIQKWDPEGLAEKINCLLENPDEMHKIGIEGRDLVVRRFSLDRMVDEYRSLYEEMF